jgi:hypothetical protein
MAARRVLTMGKQIHKKASNITIEEKIALAQEYTRLWAQFFNFFGDGFEGRKISEEAEAQFFRNMTELARMEFRLSYYAGDKFRVGPAILNLLSQAVSLTNIHQMSESQFAKFQYDWHVIFIGLNKCLGRLIQARPEPKEGQRPAVAQARAPQAPSAPPPPPQAGNSV